MRIYPRNQVFMLCCLYIVLATVCVVTSHPHRRSRNHNQYPYKNHVNQNHRKHHWRSLEDPGLNAGPSNDAYSESHHNSVIKPAPSFKKLQNKENDLLFDYDEEDETKEVDEYEEDEDSVPDIKSPAAAPPQSSSSSGRHAYLMTSDHLPTTPAPDEDKTLNEAFIKHMQPTNQYFKNPHDVYAYKLPSDLWFIVRYKRNPQNGQTEKYMNVVSSFTNYLDKLDDLAKSVSVNVKGVETVFRLTAKKPSNTN